MVSVGSVMGGDPGSPNVMPAKVEITGTCRTFRDSVRDTVERRMRELAASTASAYGCEVEVQYKRGGSPLVNQPEQTSVAAAAAAALVGAEAVETEAPPTTGGEDFAEMLKRVPGAFMFIGNGAGEGPHAAGLHTPDYDFNDAITPTGAAFGSRWCARSWGWARRAEPAVDACMTRLSLAILAVLLAGPAFSQPLSTVRLEHLPANSAGW